MKVRGIVLFVCVIGAMHGCDGKSHSLGRPAPSAGAGSGGESGAEQEPGGESGAGGSAGISGAAGDESGGTSGSAGRGGGSGGTSISAGNGGKGGGGGSMMPVAGEAGASTGGGPQGTEIDTVSEFNAARWAAVCRAYFECTVVDSDETAGFRMLVETEEGCVRLFLESIAGTFGMADLAEAVDEGRVILAREQIPACLEATADCSYFYDETPSIEACRRVFEGTKSIGEPCLRDEECMDVGRCVVTDACPGTCEPRSSDGGSCEDDVDCDGSNGHISCELGSCGEELCETCFASNVLPPVGEGEECWKASESNDDQPCAEGMWCEGDGIYPLVGEPWYEYRRGICRSSAIPAGEPCNNDEDVCESGFGCPGEASVCEPILIVHEPGAACGAGFCNPFERLECVNGFCEITSDGLEGSPCKFLDLFAYRGCEPGLACVATRADDPVSTETPHACLPPRAEGESCLRHHECASHTCGRDKRCANRFCANAELEF